MTNDEARMTKEARNPDEETTDKSARCLETDTLSSSLGLAASFVIRASSFVILSSCLVSSALAADSKISASDLDFFETKIRPVLTENCYKCHSQGAEKIKG